MNDDRRNIVGLHHAQITVEPHQAERARHFYCTVLGLTEIVKPETLIGRGGFWLQVGTVQVHVGVEAGVDRTRTKAHLGYQVCNLSAWRRRLTDLGTEILDCVPIPGHERIEFRDPFGNRVELIERAE